MSGEVHEGAIVGFAAVASLPVDHYLICQIRPDGQSYIYTGGENCHQSDQSARPGIDV